MSLLDTALLVDIASILETSVDCILNGGKTIMNFDRRISVKDIRTGIDSLATLGNLIGRETTIYRGMVDGINTKMNIDVEGALSSSFLTEALVVEMIIQNMANGRYVDISDIKSNLQHQKWVDIACQYAEKYGIK